jgi:transposase
MRKIKEVLRLRFGLGLQQDQIARSCSIGQATVHRYLERAAAVGLGWPLPEDCDESRLNELLFPARPVWPPSPQRAGVHFSQIHGQLQTHRHLTLQLLWEEYREAHPDGYGYSRFCELYQRWNRNQDVVLRQEHRAGEKTFVDWAGDSMPIHDRETGETTPASIFVAALGASTYLCTSSPWPRACELDRLPRACLRLLPGHHEVAGTGQSEDRCHAGVPL